MNQFIIRQAYRLYAIVLPVWAAVTYAWLSAVVEMSPAVVGGGWYALAVYGAALALVLYSTQSETLFVEDARARIEKLESNPLSRQPMNLYMVLLAGWGAVSFGWWAGGGELISHAVIGYGWYAIAAIGVVIAIGLAATNTDALLEAASLSPNEAGGER